LSFTTNKDGGKNLVYLQELERNKPFLNASDVFCSPFFLIRLALKGNYFTKP
jgi:hypothetical protein